jgi:hypothetical protein
LLLTQLVSKWAASALRRAGDTPLLPTPRFRIGARRCAGALMDDMTTRQVPWDKLDTLVPGEALR